MAIDEHTCWTVQTLSHVMMCGLLCHQAPAASESHTNHHHLTVPLQVHLMEKMPWHDALYFVTSTITTVGYGDVVITSHTGKPLCAPCRS